MGSDGSADQDSGEVSSVQLASVLSLSERGRMPESKDPEDAYRSM